MISSGLLSGSIIVLVSNVPMERNTLYNWELPTKRPDGATYIVEQCSPHRGVWLVEKTSNTGCVPSERFVKYESLISNSPLTQRIMKNNTQAMPVAAVQWTNPMFHIHPVITLSTFSSAEICGEDDHIPSIRY